MATDIATLESRIRDLEYVVRQIQSKLDDAARCLKRADDSDVQMAGRRLS